MIFRTTTKTAIFSNPFTLSDYDGALPSGSYEIEIDEELVEGAEIHEYHQVLTLIRVPAKSKNVGDWQWLTISSRELNAALTPDLNRLGPVFSPTYSSSIPVTREAEIDRQAIDRAENEGMVVHARKPVSDREKLANRAGRSKHAKA